MVERLSGKVVLIAGAAGSQGQAEAALFAAEGASMVLGDVRRDEAERVADAVARAGRRVASLSLDVTIEADWQSAVRLAEERFGRLDALVNNAAILSREGVEATTRDGWDRVLAVNLTGAWLGMKNAIPALRRAGGGAIVNVASVDGIVGKGGAAAYQASKGGLRILSKSAAVEYGRERIRVNCVDPGLMRDRMAIIVGGPAPANPAMLDRLVEDTPLARMANPEDVAYAVLYLISDESAFVTGTDLVVDGGYVAR